MIELVVSGLLVVVAAVAVFYVARASNDVRRAREQQDALYKQAKSILTQFARTESQFKRVTQNVYEYQRKVDVVLLDPKVQAVLNRHES